MGEEPDDLGDLTPSAEATARHEEPAATTSERLAADQKLRDSLAASNFTGPGYHHFESALARYGLQVLGAWLWTGRIFAETAKCGYRLDPTSAELQDLVDDAHIRDELVNMTVGVALHRFRIDALIGEGWHSSRGASLTTYFVGTCVRVFPNEFRKARSSRHQRLKADHAANSAGPGMTEVADPAIYIAAKLAVRHDLGRLRPGLREIVALALDGYSHREIAELVGRTAKAVERALHRWRRAEQERRQRGGD